MVSLTGEPDFARFQPGFTPGAGRNRAAGNVHRFRILGPIDVDGGSDRVPRGRTLSFLALLLIHRGAIVPIDRVVDELWEGEGPEHARKAVQVVASRLRRAVREVISEGGGYAL